MWSLMYLILVLLGVVSLFHIRREFQRLRERWNDENFRLTLRDTLIAPESIVIAFLLFKVISWAVKALGVIWSGITSAWDWIVGLASSIVGLLGSISQVWSNLWHGPFATNHPYLKFVILAVVLFVGFHILVFIKDMIWMPADKRAKTTGTVSGKKSPEKQAKPDPTKRNYRAALFFTVPPGHRGVITLFGKPLQPTRISLFGWRPFDGMPGLGLKLPFIHNVIIMDVAYRPFDITTAEISTAGVIEVDPEWEIDVPSRLQAKVQAEERQLIGAQVSFDLEMLIGIDKPVRILEVDPELRNFGDRVKKLIRGIINAKLQESLGRILLEDLYHLPLTVMLLGNTEEIIGRHPSGENAVVGYERWDSNVRETVLMDGETTVLATPKDFMRVDHLPINHPQRTGARPVKLFTEDINNEKFLALVAAHRPNSIIGRIYANAFKIKNFNLEDFNPESSVRSLLDKRTSAKLERMNNLITIRRLTDDSIGERSIREIRTIGSAKSISVLLGQIADDVKKRFEIDYKPTAKQITDLIPLMEHYRTIRRSENAQFVLDLGRYIPGIAKLLGA